MKKTALLLFVLSFSINSILSQEKDSVTFKIRLNRICESYYRDKPYSVLKIPIRWNIQKNKHINITVKYDSKDCKKKIIFPENSFKLISGVKDSTLTLTIQNDSTINSKDDYFDLTLTSKDTFCSNINNQIVEIKEYKDYYLPDNLCNFAVGTNFDFAEGVKPQSFYAEISTFLPKLFALKKSNNERGIKPFGIYGGIYQNRNLSPDSSSLSILSYSKLKINGDSIGFRETLQRKPVVEINNVGLYFGLTYHVLETSQNDLKFNAYISFHTELIHQQRTTTFTYKTISIDTLLLNQIPNNARPIDKIKNINEINNNYYVGFGIPIQIKTDNIEFNFRPTFGSSWVTREDLKSFYLYQFSITEKKYGISIGGEYRGIFGEKETLISISLSKLFSLSKLLEYK